MSKSNNIIIEKAIFKELYNIACSSWRSKLDEKLAPFMFSEHIEFEQSFVEQMYSACTPDQLKVFKKIFKSYVKEDLFDQFTNYKGDKYHLVCQLLGENRRTSAYAKIKQIEKLFNGNWKVNWADRNQAKWYPYFEYAVGGRGFRFYSSDYYFSSFYGMVALYKDQKTSDFVGKTFSDLYKELSIS